MYQKYVRTSSSMLIFSLSFLFVLFEVLVAAELKNCPQIEDWGYLKIITRHRGLVVKIDGDLTGFSPLEIRALAPGLHHVQVGHFDPANWLNRDWVGEVNITAGDTSTIEVLFKRNYSINSRPFGAAVLLDQQKFGETPTFLKFDAAEIKQITLSKAGYQDTILTLGSSDIQFFDIKLRKKTGEPSLVLTSGQFSIKQKSKRNRNLFAAISLTVVSGALGIYFRKKANKEFNQYSQFGDPQQFNESFDQTKKYDKYAAVSFATFQASFALSFYFFLKKVNN